MNGRLKVKNFGVLKDIDININDFTIIIGSQAQGKSLLAKLVYFFNSLEDVNGKIFSINLIKVSLITTFFELFPEYFVYQLNNFEIVFYYDDIRYIKIEKKNDSLSSKFSKDLKKEVDIFFEEKLKLFENNRYGYPYMDLFYIFSSLEYMNKLIKSTIFIPSGRSYFSSINNNIFAMIKSKINIENLLLHFGSKFEKFRNISFPINKLAKVKSNKIEKIIKDIISGTFYFKDNEIWITNNNYDIRLNNSSSGQQEILPMILVLLGQIFYENNSENNNLNILEEPEAHLFPKYQYKITELFVLLYNLTKNNQETNKNSFFITTHSPYILSAINNFIQANNTFEELIKKSKENSKDKVSKIISEDKWLNFEKVSCYWLSNGKAQNIMNKETKLIDANIIDEISNDIASEFSSLLELEFDE